MKVRVRSTQATITKRAKLRHTLWEPASQLSNVSIKHHSARNINIWLVGEMSYLSDRHHLCRDVSILLVYKLFLFSSQVFEGR